MSKKILALAVAGVVSSALIGCGSNRAPAPAAATQEAALGIPAECPLAKIREGMSEKQVCDLIGQPNDQRVYTTGKQFNPVYYGTDY